MIFLTFSRGSPALSEISSMFGSLPNSWKRDVLALPILFLVSNMWTGILMVRA